MVSRAVHAVLAVTHRRAPLLLCLAITLAVAILVLPPTYYLLRDSLSLWDGYTRGSLTAANFRDLFAANLTVDLFKNTIIYAAGSSAIGLVTGTSLAWIVARTDLPFSRLIFAAVLVSFAIPGIIKVIGWIVLLGPNAGLINNLLPDSAAFDVFTLTGMVLIEGLIWTPVVFLLMYVPFSAMDASLEEASLMSGASTLRTFTRVTLPLAAPSVIAALILSFIRALESFETPALVGIPGGVRVLTTEIYLQMKGGLVPQYGMASAYGVLLMIVVIVLLAFYTRATRASQRFSTITGKGFKPRKVELGRLKYLVGGAAFLVCALLLLPVLALVWTSILPYARALSFDAVGSITLANYHDVISSPSLIKAVQNTLVVAAMAAAVATVLTAFSAWLTARTRLARRTGLDFLVSFPIVFPGVIAGIAVLRTYIGLPIGVYGTIWILVLGYAMKFIPYTMRYAHVGILQIGIELEESAEVCGATLLKRLRQIVWPLMVPALSVSFIFVLLEAARELPMALMLVAPGSNLLSTSLYSLNENGQVPVLAAFSILIAIAMCAIGSIAFAVSRRYGFNEHVGK